MIRIVLMGVLPLLVACCVRAAIEPLPFKVPDRVPDMAQLLSPSRIHLEGFLGRRVANNATNRLLIVDENVLLGGFRTRPGSHPWIGEHVGKFLHAATLAWANNNDPQLKAKIDRVVAELIKCQKEDGYLGTYIDQERWTSWDVWVHKYNLIGLLTYHQYTGNQPALDASRKIGDLLCSTFGPGKRDIIAAGTHVGMAATSVLEPMVILYRYTGEQKYLDFCKYVVASYDQPNGPKVLKTLTDLKRVDKTANNKAYEMTSNLVGLCELYRVTGDKTYLTPALNAWDDIVANHLYITGSSSQAEFFRDPHHLPNGTSARVAETCVTTTWIQLTSQLLRITGEARFGHELERTFFNHLAAAQRPDGAQWCYFTPLTGAKPYGASTNCCLSSGPRGMALIPPATAFTYKADGQDGLAINLFERGEITAQLAGGSVTVASDNSGETLPSGALSVNHTYTFQLDQPATFAFKVRSLPWATDFKVRVEGDVSDVNIRDGWAAVPARQWKNGDRVTASFKIATRVVVGDYSNKGYLALAWGPAVLAFDQSRNPDLPPASTLMLAEDPATPAVKLIGGNPITFEAHVRTTKDPQPKTAIFVSFAEAGADGGRYQVWLRDPNNAVPVSLLADGKESRSRQGNIPSSIIDGEAETHVVTFDGKPADEDWFAVTLDSPVTIKRIVFAHGHCFHDGGWFDASAGKPRIQIQREKNGAWETVGALDSYPATTATNPKRLEDGQEYTLTLSEPVKAVAVRIVGKPAHGDNRKQAFSSCGELQAFGD